MLFSTLKFLTEIVVERLQNSTCQKSLPTLYMIQVMGMNMYLKDLMRLQSGFVWLVCSQLNTPSTDMVEVMEGEGYSLLCSLLGLPLKKKKSYIAIDVFFKTLPAQ